jgi:hypothetical protein
VLPALAARDAALGVTALNTPPQRSAPAGRALADRGGQDAAGRRSAPGPEHAGLFATTLVMFGVRPRVFGTSASSSAALPVAVPGSTGRNRSREQRSFDLRF